MQILPYNRVLKDLNMLMPGQLMQKLNAVFFLSPGDRPAPLRDWKIRPAAALR